MTYYKGMNEKVLYVPFNALLC